MSPFADRVRRSASIWSRRRRRPALSRAARRRSAYAVEPLESRRLLAATVTIGATPNVAEGDAITVTFNVTDPAVFYGPTPTYVVGCRIEGSVTVNLDYLDPDSRSGAGHDSAR